MIGVNYRGALLSTITVYHYYLPLLSTIAIYHCYLPLLIIIHHYRESKLLVVGIIWFPEPPKEALKNPSKAQRSLDAAMDLGWLERRSGGCSEPPKRALAAVPVDKVLLFRC